MGFTAHQSAAGPIRECSRRRVQYEERAGCFKERATAGKHDAGDERATATQREASVKMFRVCKPPRVQRSLGARAARG